LTGSAGARAGVPPALGPRHREVRRLRALLRDPKARAEERAFVLEGPRLIEDALRRGVEIDAVYLGEGARAAFPRLLADVEAAGVRRVQLGAGVLEKVGTTRTPQPVLAVTARPEPPALASLVGAGPVLVLVGVADPGNLGTLLRSAEAAGCAGVVCCGPSVDVHHPRVVRSSAGSVFGIPVVERVGPDDDPVAVVGAVRASGRRVLGATVDGRAATEVDLAGPVALVLGNEAHGLDQAVRARVDGSVSVPMTGDAESLNVAMAGTVLVFEAQRQRGARQRSN